MIRPYVRLASVSALALLFLPLLTASAQETVPPATSQAPAATVAPTQVPAAPSQVPPAAPAPTNTVEFPKIDPQFFTATTPTKETVDAFLQASWGYDANRVWQVQGILKTRVPDVSKVVVLIGDKSGKQKMFALQFFVLPDGKHLISGNAILPFGEHPFAEDRAMLEQQADGPYHGNAAKDLELVEFADLQSPASKAAQTIMDRLGADFPNARIVFENYPLAKSYPESVKAASYGICVTQMGGSTAFFQYAGAVFDGQAGLSTQDGATLTLNSAVMKAGLDPAKVAACAAKPETAAAVEKSVKLAESLSVMLPPVLMVNGREVPLGNVPYDTVKQIVEYQIKLDSVPPAQ